MCVWVSVLPCRPLYEVGLDYRHGTGHGIGHFLGVHEGENMATTHHLKWLVIHSQLHQRSYHCKMFCAKMYYIYSKNVCWRKRVCRFVRSQQIDHHEILLGNY